MYNDIINELTSIEEVELIYCNNKTVNNANTFSYSIILSGDNILTDIKKCKKIIAIMEIIKELFTKYGIKITYSIKSSIQLEKEILNKNKSIIKNFKEAETIYSKDDYFQRLVENTTNKSRA